MRGVYKLIVNGYSLIGGCRFIVSLIVNGYSLIGGCRFIVLLIVNGYSLIGGYHSFTFYNYDSPITINPITIMVNRGLSLL